ncbi:MAG: ABC transporter permease [Eubacteriales bacterium]|nr:ABC transporter permease [Eubacteriales bacterium]
MNKTIEKILRKPITATVVSILFGFIVAALILAAAGYNPFSAFASLLRGTLGRPKYIANVLIKGTPIIITGLSIAFAYKMGLFNIGAEGQYVVGSIAATVVGIICDLPPVLEIPLILLAGAAAGALYGGIAGYLKARFGINEVITTIMLNWIALYLCNFISQIPPFFKSGTTGTYAIHESGYTVLLSKWKTSEAAAEFMAEHPLIGDMMRTDFNIGIFIAVILAFVISFFLFRTAKGYELRAVGFNKDAAEFAGISVKKNIIHTMLIAGALSGLAAALNITGINPHNISHLAMFEQNGMNGIAVAFIAGGSPIGCIFSGLLFGGLLYGGQSIQYDIGAPSEIINIMIGTIVFFVALTKILPTLADRFAKRGGSNA